MSTRWHVRLYGWLLQLYPPWFRNAYAAQMTADFADLVDRKRQHRRRMFWRLRVWGVVLRDLAVSLLREWSRSARRPNTASSHKALTGTKLMMNLLSDVRYALRSFTRNTGFVFVVVITLAVGIGINVAMFSVADGVLFSPLPYQNADRLAVIWNRHPVTEADKVLISGPDLIDYQDEATTFEEMVFIHNATDNTLTDGGRAEQVDVGYVSSNLFTFLGVQAVLGRTFSIEDENAAGRAMGSDAPVVLSHALWTRRYGQDPEIVGKTIFLAGRPASVIGVLPAQFKLLLPYEEGGAMSRGANDQAHVWKMLSSRGFANAPRSLAMFRVVGRLRADATFYQARDEMDAIAARLRGTYRVHAERGTRIDLVPLHADIVGPVRSTILALFGAVAIVLILACANVANLVSVRSAHRRREVSIRVALGADRGRVLRQLIVENAILAGIGAGLGVVLAAVLIKTIVALAPASVPMLDRVHIDGNALAFAIGAGIVATVLFGVLPALRASTASPGTHLSSARASHLPSSQRVRTTIVMVEIALSLVLLIGGGLLINSFLRLQRAQLGFEPASVLTARVAIGHGAYDDTDLRNRYWTSLIREVEDLPSVTRAGLTSQLPFGGVGAEVPYSNTGGDAVDWGRYVANIASATPGYFEAMGALVLDGRTFSEIDRFRTDVAVIDDLAAARLFPTGGAVGSQVWIQPVGAETRRALEIIGVIRHIRHSNAIGPEREVIYQPATNAWTLALVARVDGNPESLVSDLERIAASLDAEIPIFDIRPLASYISDRNASTRFTMTLATTFGVVALIMAAVGLYGVIAYAVEQRAQEIGVRMALGATHSRIVRLVLAQGGVVAAAGMTVGLLISLGVSRLLEGLLVEVSAYDPATFLLVTVVLAGAAMLAAWVPARRAARLDPLTTLRS